MEVLLYLGTGLIIFLMGLSLCRVKADAKVLYMPDVSADMSKASYWSDKMPDPNKILAEYDDIKALNQVIATDKATFMTDLAGWSTTSFDGVAMAEKLIKAANDDVEGFYIQGCKYDADGNEYASLAKIKKAYFNTMINNCADPEATTDMPVRFAICTKRTCLLSLPADRPIRDNPKDLDFDYLYLTMVRVNEPVILRAKSADGKYYHAVTSCFQGWIDKNDVAVCKNKGEWLEAWDFNPSETLVVYDNKICTEISNTEPAISNVMLPMGTCLKLASDEEAEGRINNRTAFNNHVACLPVRKQDGTYDKKLCLIRENQKVSEGYLPLTPANIAMVALNQLGDTYGWGGMMGSDDCSGFVRNVYKCFGLEMARNTGPQANQPVKKYILRGLSDEKKTETIQSLPLGAVLFMNNHEMIYLGTENDKLYIINALSKAVFNPGEKPTVIRGCVINTLDVCRGNGNTWLQELHTAEIPYLPGDNI